MTLGENADQETVGRLAQAVADFKARYEKLSDVRYGAAIARTHDSELMLEYGNALQDAEALKRKIEAVTGAWDNIKQWAGLGALPLIPIAIALGLIGAISAGTIAINKFMRRADIVLAIKQDPTLTYDEAAKQVDAASQSDFGRALDVAKLALYVGGAFFLYKVFARR